MALIYFLVALVSTIAGSLAGLGGGVIIKPVLDILGNYSVQTISVLSSFTVFVMAVVSIIKQTKYGVKFETSKTIYIGFGSILGGVLGEWVLGLSLSIVNNESVISIIQNMVLAVLLTIIIIYMNNKSRFKRYKVENKIVCIIVGLSLGLLSAFLGIGGGPINVCVLSLIFSLDTKEAAINSIIIILFSQSSKLFTVLINDGFNGMDLSMLPFMIIGAILGGTLGSSLNRVLNNKTILTVFNVVIITLIGVNVYNII
ncbi:sulfite exporter TauE/SafE family protein [Clostridium sp. LY3-2]|uniref:sulfite exporter TauE/SafE family protein n=1 Tax=Clostridium sp. LY3-2 TaxID=2942482 RepID=UPI0021534AE3|nr:sulfite exporter TauE/SafE family protein [Clostridium sp. LY3-2]MCR6514371.1 sulfite exporter TauE/SafE family protein [Clostridium sp. LY3-2]